MASEQVRPTGQGIPATVKKTAQPTKPAAGQTPATRTAASQSNPCPKPNNITIQFCAMPSKPAKGLNLPDPNQVSLNNKQWTDEARTNIANWTNDMINRAKPHVRSAAQASGKAVNSAYTQTVDIMHQMQNDVASIPNFRPNPKGMTFNTGFNLSLTPAANGSYILETPVAKPARKPAHSTNSASSAVKHPKHAQSAQQAPSPTAATQQSENKMEEFARRYWADHYPNLPYGAEASKKVIELANSIGEYKDYSKRPLNVKFNQKFADEYYAKHAAKVEEYINAHPEIQDKNAFRNLFYATVAQESSFRPNTVTLLPHVPDRFSQSVNGLRTKQTEYTRAVNDLNHFPPEKVAEIQRQYDEQTKAFADKYHVSLTNNQMIDTRLKAVKTRLDSFKPYTVAQADRAFLANIERQRATGAKINPADAKKAALIQQKVSKADASETKRAALNEQLGALTALRQVAQDKTRAQSAAQRKANNTLSEQDRFKSLVLGQFFDQAQAGIKNHKYKNLPVALTQIAQSRLPKEYTQAEANGMLVMTKTQQDLIDQIQDLKRITDRTPEQDELLKKLQTRLGTSEHPASVRQINRGYMQDEIMDLRHKTGLSEDENNEVFVLQQKTTLSEAEKNRLATLQQKSNLSEDDKKRLAVLQQKECLNLINEALPSAKGIGQLMDENCYLYRDKSTDSPGHEKELNPFDVDQNTYGAIAELADLSTRAAKKGLKGDNKVRYVACAYNGGPVRANANCLPNGIFPAETQNLNLPDETKIHIGKVTKYVQAYDAIFTNARTRREDYTNKLESQRDELVNAINTTNTFAQQTNDKYIEIGKKLDATHKPAPVEQDLRPDSVDYWKQRLGFGK